MAARISGGADDGEIAVLEPVHQLRQADNRIWPGRCSRLGDPLVAMGESSVYEGFHVLFR